MEPCSSRAATESNRFRRLVNSCCCSSCLTAEPELQGHPSPSVAPVDALSEDQPSANAADHSLEIPGLPEDRPHDTPSPVEPPIKILPDLNGTASPHADDSSRSHDETPEVPMADDAPLVENAVHVPERLLTEPPPPRLQEEDPRQDLPPALLPVGGAPPKDTRLLTPDPGHVPQRIPIDPPAPQPEADPRQDPPPACLSGSNAPPEDVRLPIPDPDHSPEALLTEPPAPPTTHLPFGNAPSGDACTRLPTSDLPRCCPARVFMSACSTGDESFTAKTEETLSPDLVTAAQNISATIGEGGDAVGSTNERGGGGACWVFMHMGQTGGEAARQIAIERWRKDGDPRLFDTVQWRRGDHAHQADAMGSRWRLLHGGCVESLRDDGAQARRPCKWMTVFRHPVGRLLSAYDHCRRHAPDDPVCPPRATQGTDLATFAEGWGNFAMRQFAMAAVPPSDVKEWAARDRAPRDASLWYLVREYLTRGGVVTEEEALRDMLRPVQELLSTRYAAVGIAAELDTTMRLFDEALSMEGLDWVSTWSKLRRARAGGDDDDDDDDGEHGDEDVDEDEGYDAPGSATFRGALENRRITSALRLDILLYEHAERVFEAQVALRDQIDGGDNFGINLSGAVVAPKTP